MTRVAQTDHPVHEFVSGRYSPYGFQDRDVAVSDLRSLFEAARWAPSCYNEQPWRYLVATRDDSDEYDRLLSCLVEPNQEWAKQAPVLVLCVASDVFERNGKPNASAQHDVGLASATLTLEATSRGLSVHQMGGILPDRAAELYGIPGSARAVTALAIGYAADPAGLPAGLRERDTAPRRRRPLTETVFGGSFGATARLVAE